VRLAPGTYLLIILNNVRGAPDGARLVRVDVEGETPVRLTRSAIWAARWNAVFRAAMNAISRQMAFHVGVYGRASEIWHGGRVSSAITCVENPGSSSSTKLLSDPE
jgi:hypothetical protein